LQRHQLLGYVALTRPSLHSATRSRLKEAALPLFAALATAVVFWTCLRCGFITFDDPFFLERATRGLGASAWRELLTRQCLGKYAPLSSLTLAADFALWGVNPFGYHLTNLILHAANAALFYALALELFAAGAANERDRASAVVAALAFSLHPLRVQSVAWTSERHGVTCGFFFLLTLLLWLRSFRPGETRAARWRTASLGAFFLALLSKPAAIPLPAVLFLLDVWPLRRWTAEPRRRSRERLLALALEKAPFLALSAVFSVVAVYAQARAEAIVSMAAAPLAQRAPVVLIGLVFYLGKTLWPAALGIYELNWHVLREATLVGAAATAALLAAAAARRRLRAPLLCALAYQTIMLAPVLGFITLGHETGADRYSYLSGLAWAALAGAGFRALARARPVPAVALAAVALMALSIRSRAQIEIWKDSRTFWRHDLRVNPFSVGARIGLADYYARDGASYGRAILYLEEQTLLFPEDAKSRKVLDELTKQHHVTKRDHARFHEQFGREFAARAEFAEAAWHFERALRYDPASRKLRGELADARRNARRAPAPQ